MSTQDFLAAVLPSSGVYCAVELSATRQHEYVEALDALENVTTLFDTAHKNTYFALASFKQAGSRQASNASLMRSLFVDLDVGTGEKTYHTKRAAVEALDKFIKDTGLAELGSPWLVDSGGGVHAYWPLDADASIEAWKTVAEAFKRKARERGFKIDMTVTADAARILRPPGTTNWKYDPPRPVTLRNRGAVFSLNAIGDLLGAEPVPVPVVAPLSIPGAPLVRGTALVTQAPSALAVSLAQSTTTSFKRIMMRTVQGTGCGQLAHYVDHAKEDGMEPLWRGLLSIAQKCEDGSKAVIKLSAMHPYSLERTEQKLAEIKGPYPCSKFDSENPGICTACRHWGQITNPLSLGRTLLEAAEAVDVEVADGGDDGTHVKPQQQRPQLPAGFMFVQGGGIASRRRVELPDGSFDTVTTPILPYDFYLVDVLLEDDAYMSRFVAERKTERVFVAFPNRALGSKDELIKILASQNIIATAGSGNDKNLFDYVRACTTEAARDNRYLRIPATMGWQPDGSFAISDEVIQRGAPSYTIVSDRLHNVIECTTTKGTLQGWARIMEMLQTKGLNSVLAFMGAALGSPLMKYLDSGTAGMTFHACGVQSGAGKSYALYAAASVWGSPKHYAVVPSTSGRTMLQRAGLLGHLPLLVDEVTNSARGSNNEWIPEFVFDFSQGAGKIKGSASANGEIRNKQFWNSIAVLTSNAPVMEKMLGARDTTSSGEVHRLLEWQTEDKIVWTEVESEIRETLRENYGVAGRRYAKWLVENEDTVQEVVASTHRMWKSTVQKEDVERFWTVGCTAIVAGIILAGPRYANICNLNVLPIIEFLKSLIARARRLIASNATVAEDIINNYMREFHGQFVKIGPEQNGVAVWNDMREVRKDSTRGRVAGRIEYDVNPGWVDQYIDVGTFKRFCAKHNQSYENVIAQITHNSKMVVTECRRDLLARTASPPMRMLCVKISRRIGDED